MADVARQCDFLLIGYRNPTTDKPLENGEVYTYLDGTTTESALWVDRNKASRASNPITLDANGRAEVYGDNVYKFEIYEQRDDDGTIGAKVETINGVDLFAGESLTDEWVTQTGDISYASGTSIEVTGDTTSSYHAGRRIKASGASTGTVYGTISSSSYSSGTNKTTVNITWDSGNLSNESLSVFLALLGSTNTSIPSHGSVHQEGGYDELDVADLSGAGGTANQVPKSDGASVSWGDVAHSELSGVSSDQHHAKDHASTHQNGGVDEISVAGLSGSLADAQTPTAHATSHESGGSDEIDAASLAVTKSLANSGYTYLPGGVLLQWGRTGELTFNDGTQAVTFALEFPTAIYALTTTINTTSGSISGSVDAYTTSISTTGFTIKKNYSNAADETGYVHYIAIGS